MIKKTLTTIISLIVTLVVLLLYLSSDHEFLSNQGQLHEYDMTDTELPSVFLEELTWPEVQYAVKTGFTGVIIPTGGVEQNGPHMELGKHNVIIRYTAEEIAKRLGQTLIAPVIKYVPEGSAKPKTGHMRFPGTISIDEDTFEAILEETIKSLISHGFNRFYLIGDSGGNQDGQNSVAKRLSKEFESMGIEIVHVSDYYSNNDQMSWLHEEGYSVAEVGTHAGIRDTSEYWRLREKGIREEWLETNGGGETLKTGVSGDPTKASQEIGEKLLELKIKAAVNQIKHLSAGRERS